MAAVSHPRTGVTDDDPGAPGQQHKLELLTRGGTSPSACRWAAATSNASSCFGRTWQPEIQVPLLAWANELRKAQLASSGVQ